MKRRARREAGIGDALLVNTCAVTAEAVRQARQAIRRARRDDAAAAASSSPAAPRRSIRTCFAAMPEVDLVLGNAEKLAADAYQGLARRNVGVAAENASASTTSWRSRRARAPTRSRASPAGPAPSSRCRTAATIAAPSASSPTAAAIRAPCRWAAVVAEVRAPRRERLPRGGADRRRHHRLGRATSRRAETLGQLVRAHPARTSPTCRGSASPRSTPSRPTPSFSRAIAEEERLMPHLHLSLQSGDDLILKRMKRRHSRADAIAFCEKVRQLASRRRLRRRPHRRLPDRDGGDVREQRCRSSRNATHLPARLSRSRRARARRPRECRRYLAIHRERARAMTSSDRSGRQAAGQDGGGGRPAPARPRREATASAAPSTISRSRCRARRAARSCPSRIARTGANSPDRPDTRRGGLMAERRSAGSSTASSVRRCRAGIRASARPRRRSRRRSRSCRRIPPSLRRRRSIDVPADIPAPEADRAAGRPARLARPAQVGARSNPRRRSPAASPTSSPRRSSTRNAGGTGRPADPGRSRRRHGIAHHRDARARPRQSRDMSGAEEVRAVLAAEVEKVLAPVARPLVVDRTQQAVRDPRRRRQRHRQDHDDRQARRPLPVGGPNGHARRRRHVSRRGDRAAEDLGRARRRAGHRPRHRQRCRRPRLRRAGGGEEGRHRRPPHRHRRPAAEQGRADGASSTKIVRVLQQAGPDRAARRAADARRDDRPERHEPGRGLSPRRRASPASS